MIKRCTYLDDLADFKQHPRVAGKVLFSGPVESLPEKYKRYGIGEEGRFCVITVRRG